jgi:hypothetical protein
MTEKYVGCSVRQLPQETLVEAARTAIAENPANAPAISFLLPGGLFAPQHLAMLTSKWWGNGGVKLTVSFLDNPDQATRRLILEHANAWGTRANVSFVETAQGGQVRIARAADGYWSYLGTDVLHISANGPTMNLEGFTSNTPLSEYKRVVKHEFGHTLGWPHEHMRKEIVARIDPQKAIAYFARTQGWNAQMVREQVLTPLLDSEITALASDVVSIMCYELPGEITGDGTAHSGRGGHRRRGLHSWRPSCIRRRARPHRRRRRLRHRHRGGSLAFGWVVRSGAGCYGSAVCRPCVRASTTWSTRDRLRAKPGRPMRRLRRESWPLRMTPGILPPTQGGNRKSNDSNKE